MNHPNHNPDRDAIMLAIILVATMVALLATVIAVVAVVRVSGQQGYTKKREDTGWAGSREASACGVQLVRVHGEGRADVLEFPVGPAILCDVGEQPPRRLHPSETLVQIQPPHPW